MITPCRPLDFAMGTLKRFYRNVLQNRLSFSPNANEDRIHTFELESHLATVRYNGFTLTEAIRPSLNLTIIPEQGYKHENLTTENDKHFLYPHRHLSILEVSVSLENLFETFLELLDPLGTIVNVVLETSHGLFGTSAAGVRREHIDLPILKSYLYDHEELLLNDGCTGISIFTPNRTACVKFDDHKLILIYAKSLLPFENILRRRGIVQNERLELLTDAEHIHITRDEYVKHFRALRLSLGMDERYTAAR